MESNITTIVGIITIAGAAISVAWSIVKFRERLLTLENKVNSILENKINSLENKINGIDRKLEDKMNDIDRKFEILISKMDNFREDYHKLNERVIKLEIQVEKIEK